MKERNSSPMTTSMIFIIGLMWFVFRLSAASPATSASSCTSQIFTNRNLYNYCADLPTLNSYLHWTYFPSISSLSIAFIASPSTPDGWIAWAINPTATGMVGAQTLLAFKTPDGSMTVKAFDIKSYNCTVESKLAFDFWDLRAESSADGVIVLFVTVELPAEIGMVNLVWQVGPAVIDGVPTMHELGTPNLESKGTLTLSIKTGATFGDRHKQAKCQSDCDRDKTRKETIRFRILLGLSLTITISSTVTLTVSVVRSKKAHKNHRPPTKVDITVGTEVEVTVQPNPPCIQVPVHQCRPTYLIGYWEETGTSCFVM